MIQVSLADKLSSVVRDTQSEETYECVNCESRFVLDRQTCPDCGGCTIDRIEWDSVLAE